MWQCSECNSRNWLTRETCQDCEKKRQTTDVVIGAKEFLKPKTPVRAAEGACKAACEAGLPPALLSELHAEFEVRKAEREAEKPIGREVPGCDEGTHRGQHRAAGPDDRFDRCSVLDRWFRRGVQHGSGDGADPAHGGTSGGTRSAANGLQSKTVEKCESK